MKDTEDQLVQTEEPELIENPKSDSSQSRNQMGEEGASSYNPILHNYAVSQYQQTGSVLVKDDPK